MRATSTVQQGLESQCSELASSLTRCQAEHTALLAACALLCSIVYPLSRRVWALGAERALVGEQWVRLEDMRGQVRGLMEALRMDETQLDARVRRREVVVVTQAQMHSGLSDSVILINIHTNDTPQFNVTSYI